MEFRLALLRKQRKISQLKLASDLNMNQNTISRYETGSARRITKRSSNLRIILTFLLTTSLGERKRKDKGTPPGSTE